MWDGKQKEGFKSTEEKIISTKKTKGGNPQYVKLMTEVNLISLSSKLFRDKDENTFKVRT